jgi:hypothetical protein
VNETRAQKLYKARMVFEGSKYEPVVEELTYAYSTNDSIAFDELLEKLPTNIQMLDSILEKVKHKSVFTTLKKTVAESVDDNAEKLIGVSSLMTRVAIECKENKEFRALLPDLYNKMGDLIRCI